MITMDALSSIFTDENLTTTDNGALAHVSSGSLICDVFGVAANYRNRNIETVIEEQERLFKEDPIVGLIFPFYLRMVTRKIKVNDKYTTSKVQNGQGNRDEAFKRMLGLAKNHSELFHKNLAFLPLVGSWKDIWTLLYYDEKYEIYAIDKNLAFTVLSLGLNTSAHSELVKKFMPRIKSHSKLKTERSKILNSLAKQFAKFLDIDAATYNKIKAHGTAHEFQKMISEGRFGDLNWKNIPGRALSMLVNSKFMANHNLEDGYIAWLDQQSTVKFTGYPYELYKHLRTDWHGNIMNSKVEQHTINKQFNQLIETAHQNRSIKENIWCVLDTSGSMSCEVVPHVSALAISNSLGIFFSTLNEGAFHKHVIMFDDRSQALKLQGEFCDMASQIPMDAMGSTNFQSVVDEIVRIRRKHPEISLDDYPKTLLVVSDMQFNPARGYSWHNLSNEELEKERQTNYEACKTKLAECFPQEWVDSMKFIWWNVVDRQDNVPATMEDGGCYLLSGFDGSILSTIMGLEDTKNENGEVVHPSMEDVVTAALSQEIFQHFYL